MSPPQSGASSRSAAVPKGSVAHAVVRDGDQRDAIVRIFRTSEARAASYRHAATAPYTNSDADLVQRSSHRGELLAACTRTPVRRADRWFRRPVQSAYRAKASEGAHLLPAGDWGQPSGESCQSSWRP